MRKRKYVEKIDLPLNKENHTLSFLFEKVTGGYRVLVIETYYYPEKEKFSYRGPKAIYGLEFMTMIEPGDFEESLRGVPITGIYERYIDKDYDYFSDLFKV